ncbi:hypothetical protein NDU88_004198 [Pleurodeles waltl]|uniref:Uncharacterized protein n=1 Tax=Pleurodeles waltl TaxID=8319 RepID=A0AAV7MSS8_PLEWA|nr:hypothetical protein NDU88_004198 [Pleurodeles waltl]
MKSINRRRTWTTRLNRYQGLDEWNEDKQDMDQEMKQDNGSEYKEEEDEQVQWPGEPDQEAPERDCMSATRSAGESQMDSTLEARPDHEAVQAAVCTIGAARPAGLLRPGVLTEA